MMMSWHVGDSGKHGCLRQHAAFLLHPRRPCRSPGLCRSSKLPLLAVQPAENVRVSLAVPSVSVVPTGPDSVEATAKQGSPVRGGQSSQKEDETKDVQDREGLQSGPKAIKPAPLRPRSAVESKDVTRDRRQTLPGNTKIVKKSSQSDAERVEERTGSGREASTSEREIEAEVKDDLGGDISTDKGRIAGDTNRGSVASSSSGTASKYAEEKASRQHLLRHLQEARERSRRLQESLRGNTAVLAQAAQLPTAGQAPSTLQLPSLHRQFDPAAFVDRKVYDQLRASRNRLSKQLSERNRDLLSLEQRLHEREQDLVAAAALLEKLRKEAEASRQLAEKAAAALTYGVDRTADRAHAADVVNRLVQLQNAFSKEMQAMDAKVPREVPVAWFGVASEVRLMGSFDGWTRGVDLSADDISDSVFTRFEATVLLLPGQHEVKFLVDGNWRLAPHWPSITNALGDTNNLLSVT
ncbi:probable 5'-AMP-activated protein kinase subunit beta-1 at C-terminar half [Coccomyxa sp. Obi]|nr:probable 5'-AMP-activated protein kinase subunit beta-1 at C-terminar half [Coccomyxa sp. Obi]